MLEHTLPLFQKLHVPPLEYMYMAFALDSLCTDKSIVRHLLLLFPKLLLTKMFTIMKPLGSGNAHVQYRRTHKVATNFGKTAPHYWNALPYEIRNAGSITTFNKLHKALILRHAMT